jgi:hypothetical protein
VALRVNYFRAMAGVPAQIALSDAYNAKAQQAALMMSVNNQLSHDPPATWQCYTADGDQAAGSSNLALGIYGWNAITGYIQDPGSSNGAVGDRRWILYPQAQTMGTGDVPSDSGGPASNELWVFDGRYGTSRPPVRDTFVARPPPGFVPYQVVFPRWSFSYPAANFSSAAVTMTLDGQNVSLVQEGGDRKRGEHAGLDPQRAVQFERLAQVGRRCLVHRHGDERPRRWRSHILHVRRHRDGPAASDSPPRSR